MKRLLGLSLILVLGCAAEPQPEAPPENDVLETEVNEPIPPGYEAEIRDLKHQISQLENAIADQKREVVVIESSPSGRELAAIRRELERQRQLDYHETRRREIESQGGSYWAPQAPLAPVGAVK